MAEPEDTRILKRPGSERPLDSREMLAQIYAALQEKGYDPVRQIAYYLITGEPAYITAHGGARTLAAKLERHEVIEALVRAYLEQLPKP